MKKKLLVFLSLVLVLSLFAGCAKKEAPAGNGDAETIKIGVNYELTGGVASYGVSLNDGLQMALEEINANGGIFDKQLEVMVIDNKSSDTESASVSAKLARDGAVVLLGPATSGNVKAAIPAANENKIPLISASSTADDVTLDANGKVRPYIFKTCFSDSFQGVMMAEFALNDLGDKNAAILADTTSDYAQGLAKAFTETYKAGGGTILGEEAYVSKETDFRPVLTNIKALNPEVLFVPGYYEEVGLIVKQARELGINIPIIGADGYESPKFSELAGEVNDVYYSSHYSPSDTAEKVVAFNTAFKEKFDREPNAFNALGYDLGYFFKDALERAGEVDSEKLKVALEATDGFEGVTGVISIDEFHNPVKSITINQVINGEVEFLKKLDPK